MIKVNFINLGINHSIRFVNRLNNNIHTNTIEREW